MSTVTMQKTLPRGFQPGFYDILIGRGKRCYEHIGNKNFLVLVASKLNEYSTASSKSQKTKILASIISEIKMRSPHSGFIKMGSNGLWYQVEENAAREKISQTFRDALHDSYKSSTSSRKRARTTKKSIAKRAKISTPHQMSQSNEPNVEQSDMCFSESCRYISDFEPSSSDSESDFLHQQHHVEAFDDESLDQIYPSHKIDLDLHNFAMEKEECTDVIQTDDEDCADLISTCSSFLVNNDEESDEFNICSLGNFELNNTLLLEDKILQDQSSQLDNFRSPCFYFDKKSQSFSEMRNFSRLTQSRKSTPNTRAALTA